MRVFLAAVVLASSSTAFAQNAQDELERQLKEMVGKPPTKLRVEYEGLDEPNYKLVEIAFTLDGQALPVPAIEKLNVGKVVIWHGDIKSGRHRLETNAIFTDVSGVLFSYEAGYKWNVRKSIGFDQQPGLEVRILITPDLNNAEKDPKKKFDLKTTSDVKMLAKLEDGTMPDAPKPNLPVAEEAVDAGTTTTVVALSPAEKARQAAAEKAAAKKAAEEEKKRQREEALAAKKAAAEEKKRQREEALAAKKAAAEEAKRQKAEALAAKKAAAEDAKHQKADATAANDAQKVASAEGTPNPNGAATPEPEAAKAPEPPDSGTAVAVADSLKPSAPAAAAPAVEEKSSMMPVIVGVGIALLGVIVFLATRRKKSPPQF